MMKKQEMLYKAGLTAMIWILVFQNPLESVWSPFSYIDEGMALFGAFLGLYDIVFVRKFRPSKDQLWMGIPLLAFVIIGLAGNLIYQYQPLKCVIIDLYTNLKFFFAIGTGYYLFARLSWEETEKVVRWNSAVITTILFILFLVDQIFHFWPAQIKYGIYSAQLFYYHMTYLAAVMSFLLVLQTVFYQKKNIPFLIMAVIVMAFTLRSKAIASAAIYVAMFIFFVVLKWHLKLWHVIVTGVGVAVLGWEKIWVYFFYNAGKSARSIMLSKSFLVMRDHAPIGSGFGTYGSAEAGKHYSPVYVKYGFNDHFFVRDVRDVENTMRLIHEDEEIMARYQLNPEWWLHRESYMNDHFWPIIFGQGGYLGTAAFLATLAVLVKKIFALEKINLFAYVGVLYAFVYLLISSTAEPAFHNALAVPLAVVTGMAFAFADAQKKETENG